MVFLHENAGNIGLRMDYFELAYKRLNCDILAIAYRGYSDSDGYPDETLIKEDMVVINAYIKENFKHKYYHAGGVFIVGRSLGGAVGVFLAHYNEYIASENYYEHNFNGVVIENTFLSIDSMVDVIFPFLKYIKGLILRLHWRNEDLIG
jgi:pimeloyl-ACP methyl ester carboxylesterase